MSDRITEALRPSKKEHEAKRIEIECVELPNGEDGGYIVCVTPRDRSNKPGEKHKNSVGWTEPIKRVFRNEKEVLKYLGDGVL